MRCSWFSKKVLQFFKNETKCRLLHTERFQPSQLSHHLTNLKLDPNWTTNQPTFKELDSGWRLNSNDRRDKRLNWEPILVLVPVPVSDQQAASEVGMLLG